MSEGCGGKAVGTFMGYSRFAVATIRVVSRSN